MIESDGTINDFYDFEKQLSLVGIFERSSDECLMPTAYAVIFNVMSNDANAQLFRD